MSSEFDLIVVGGGITGAGIARDAAMRGLKVVLVERDTFGSKTTSASSELIHGGLKYQRDDVKVTKLSCLDSGVICSIAPFMLERQIFFIPVRHGDRHGLGTWEIFLDGYDRFQPLKDGKRHLRLSSRDALALEPELRDDIVGALTFDEWRIDPRRLTVATVASAVMHGAVALEGRRVVGFDCNKREVILRSPGGSEERLTGKVIVNATGPWAEETAKMFGGDVKLRLTKGSHVIVRQPVSKYGIVTTAKDDKPIFIMPYGNGAMIGPTNVMFYGHPSQATTSDDEVAYLLEAGSAALKTRLTFDDVTATKVGLRPQLHHWGVEDDHVSHDYAIYDHMEDGADGFYTIVGGKMSTYRWMAEEMTDVVIAHLGMDVKTSTHLEMLPDVRNSAEFGSAPRPALVTSPRRLPNRWMALSGHADVKGAAFQKKLYANARLLYLGLLHGFKTMTLTRRRADVDSFRRHYDVR